MKTVIILDVRHNSIHAHISPKTNDTMRLVENTCKNITLGIIKGNDIKFLDDDGNKIVLKNYMKNISFPIFRYIINRIPSNITVTYNYKLKTKFVALALLGTLVLTGFVMKKDIEAVEDPTTFEITDNGETLNADIMQGIFIVEGQELDFKPIETIIEKDLNENKEKINTNLTPTLLKKGVVEKEETFEEVPQVVPVFDLGWRVTDYAKTIMDSFVASDKFSYFEKNAKLYNVDPYILLAIAMNETGLQILDNQYAAGITQIEKSLFGSSVTAFNYETNQNDTVIINYENVINIDTNIKLTAMMLQNRLKEYNNNLYLTLQSYNYGPHVLNNIISIYAREKNVTEADVINNTEDLGWLEHVRNAHYNPSLYGVSNWSGTYGNGDYINSVLGYYIGPSLVNENAKTINN